MTAATEGALTRAQLSAAIGRLDTYLDSWGLADPPLGAQEARRKRDELASRYMQDWVAPPVDDPIDAIDLLDRIRLELYDELPEFDGVDILPNSPCVRIALLAYEIVFAAWDHVVQKSFKEMKNEGVQ